MTKRNHDLLRDVLDELCVTPIYTAACARCGISTKTLWRYIRISQRKDDPRAFAWSGATSKIGSTITSSTRCGCRHS